MSSASGSLTDKTMSHSTKDDRKSDHPIHDESTNPTEHSQDKPEPHIVLGGKSPSSSTSPPPKSPTSSSSSSKESQKVKKIYEKASEQDQKEKTEKEDHQTKPSSKL